MTCHTPLTSETRHLINGTTTQVAEEILRVLRGEKPKVLGNPALWPRLTYLK